MNIEHFIAKVLSISRIGLKFSKDPYAIENYQELQNLALQQLEEIYHLPDEVNPYQRDVYPTPNISVRVIIFNEHKQLLLVQERDDQKYAVPGGWCDIFESAKENAIKEVKQETNLDVRIDKVLAILRRDIYKQHPSLISEYVIYFSATILQGELANNHEILSLGFYDLDKLPELSRKMTSIELHKALNVCLNNEEVIFD
jgi:8-oxo-dGTP diphosphatase